MCIHTLPFMCNTIVLCVADWPSIEFGLLHLHLFYLIDLVPDVRVGGGECKM